MSTTQNKRPIGRPKANGRSKGINRKDLLETAARLFNDRGFHGTSIQDLATRLGVTKAALYHHVPNKQDLLYQLHMISLDAADKATAQAIEEGRTGIERLRLLVYHYLSAICASPTACLILLEDDALREDHAKEVIDRRRKLEYGLRELIQSGVDDGSIIPCDTKAATFVVVGAMNWVTKWYQPGGSWNAYQIADGISAILARSLASNPVSSLPTDISQPQLTPFALPSDPTTPDS
ncbi:TetR/AcrR family transcriptional regulator [uncultured Roseibium sp.]|uniref:TetR/AcrR family transcriptional regulator n=1 Tax=uncultured Roseibium sp. TaxID=1936171 RepID=UPI003216CB79